MKTFRKTLIFLALIAIFPLVLGAESRPDLSGRVLDAEGVPLAKATVFIYTAGPKEGTSSLCPSCYLDCRKKARTDVEGRFKIESLDPTLVFRLLVVAAGHETKFVSKVDPAKGEQTIKMSSLSEEAIHSALRIKGIVVNEDGKPVPEAIIDPDGIGRGQITQWGGTDAYIEPVAVTDDQGHFILLCKTNSVDKVYATVSGRGSAKKWFTFKPGGDYLLRLDDGVTVTGRIMRDGKPLKGVMVGAASSERQCGIYLDCDTIATDSDGRFNLFNVPPTQEFVVYAAMNSLAGNGAVPDKILKTGESGAIHDLGRLEVGPAFKLGGRIVLSDHSTVPEGTRIYLGRDRTQDSMEAKVAADGSFEFAGVPAESVDLSVRIKGYRSSKRNPNLDWLNGGIMGRVTGNITDLNILLEPGNWEFNSNEQPPGGGEQQPREKPLQGVKLST